MGCDQSKGNKIPLSPTRVDRIINIEPQQIVIDSSGKQFSRKVPSAYQGVQGTKLDMDPSTLQDILQEYKDCEDKIHGLEKDDPLTLYYIKKSHLQSLDEAIQSTQEKIDNFRKATQNDETDALNKGKSLKKVVIEYGSKGGASKAEQEFLTSANRLEIATTELEMLHQDKALVESEVSEFKAICTTLAEYYGRQDTISQKLLMSVTNSEEALLYKELAEAEARKIRVSETFQRWKEGRLQAIDACRQFAFALKKWREINDDTPANLYDNTEEVRDDLVTALQSINNARFYIKSELPYCSKTEMSVLEKALSYIFIDMNSSERRLHADSCYTAFHNRAVALFAWTDMTLKTVIVPDVKKAYEELTETSGKLRDARFKTINHQFPDVTWKTNASMSMEDPEAGLTSLSELDSVRILAQLDISQLTNAPTRSEIYGKFAGGTNYKSLLKNSTSNGTTKSVFDKNIENMIEERKQSLKNDILHEDTVGLA